MRRLGRWIMGAVVAVAGGTAGAAGMRGALWDRQTDRLVESMLAAPRPEGADMYSPAELVGLPEPVVRFFEFALTPGQAVIRSARVIHEGEFRANPAGPWSPFRSVQDFNMRPAGFVWDARIRIMPLASVRVRDSYIDGRGTMLGSLAGLLTVVNESGTPHLNAGALHRHVLEAVWFPTALLPSQGVRWEAVDDSTAKASLTDSGYTVSMVVRFGLDGRILRVEADRLRDVGGTGVPTPFVADINEYRRMDGMMIPTEGIVAWLLPEGRYDFWRGRTVSAEYRLAR
jgi:hypothetical protein